MAGDKTTAQSLAQPVKAKELLEQDRRQFEDCTSCRIIGGTAFIGLGGYTYWEGMKHLEANRAMILKSKSLVSMGGRKAGIAGISIGLAWMGIYRLFG